jgi:ubiquinone/menaquinone biosynthesis C-methylase UbiE
VWDHDARTEADARRAVAGTTDPGEHDTSGEATAGYVAAQTGIGPDDVVLEIGCGVGRVGAKLARRCGHWIGADVSPRMLRHATKALEGQPNVSFRQLSGVDLEGIADESVDVAYCTAVFMHLDEWERFRYVTEMHRVLRPGGRVYFDSFHLLGDEGWGIFTKMAALDVAARPENIARASTSEELRTYAERAGFEKIRCDAGSLWVWVAAVKRGSDRPAATPAPVDRSPIPATPRA